MSHSCSQRRSSRAPPENQQRRDACRKDEIHTPFYKEAVLRIHSTFDTLVHGYQMVRDPTMKRSYTIGCVACNVVLSVLVYVFIPIRSTSKTMDYCMGVTPYRYCELSVYSSSEESSTSVSPSLWCPVPMYRPRIQRFMRAPIKRSNGVGGIQYDTDPGLAISWVSYCNLTPHAEFTERYACDQNSCCERRCRCTVTF